MGNWGTRWRITAFLVVAATFLAGSATTLLLVRRVVATDGREHALNAARAVARQSDSWLGKKTNVLDQVGRLAVQYHGQPAVFQREIATLLQSDLDLQNIFFWWTDGFTTSASGWAPPPSTDLHHRPWFVAALSKRGVVTDPFQDLHRGRWVVALSRQVVTEKGRYLGIATVTIKVSAVAHNLMIAHYPGISRILVLDRQGRIFVDSRRRATGEVFELPNGVASPQLLQALHQAEEGSFFSKDLERSRDQWLITYTHSPSSGWSVVTYTSPDVLLHPFAVFLRSWVFSSVLMLLALFLGGLFFVDRFLVPIERLVRLTQGSRVMNTEAAATDDLMGLTRSVNRLMAYIEAFPGVLNLMLGLKDGYTSLHTREVARYALAIGKAMGLSEHQLGELECAALLHDIGKAGVPDGILKKPAGLTDEEWAAIRLHPVIGAEVAAEAGFAPTITHAIRQHHERLDGSGYPDRLGGEEIGLYARIIAVADTYHAMTSNRPYRPARDTVVAQAELADGAGQKYDFRVVQAFLAVLNDDSSDQRQSRKGITELSPA